jgi:hypothetical protein
VENEQKTIIYSLLFVSIIILLGKMIFLVNENKRINFNIKILEAENNILIRLKRSINLYHDLQQQLKQEKQEKDELQNKLQSTDPDSLEKDKILEKVKLLDEKIKITLYRITCQLDILDELDIFFKSHYDLIFDEMIENH